MTVDSILISPNMKLRQYSPSLQQNFKLASLNTTHMYDPKDSALRPPASTFSTGMDSLLNLLFRFHFVFNGKYKFSQRTYLAFPPHQIPCWIYFVDPNIFNCSLHSTHAPRHLFAFKYLSRRDKRSSPLQPMWSNIQQKYVVLYSTRP